jgi:hypothetical protein
VREGTEDFVGGTFLEKKLVASDLKFVLTAKYLCLGQACKQQIFVSPTPNVVKLAKKGKALPVGELPRSG